VVLIYLSTEGDGFNRQDSAMRRCRDPQVRTPAYVAQPFRLRVDWTSGPEALATRLSSVRNPQEPAVAQGAVGVIGLTRHFAEIIEA